MRLAVSIEYDGIACKVTMSQLLNCLLLLPPNRLALRYHPDKIARTAASSSSSTAEDLKQRFQQINFSHSILVDENKRKRYDDTGRTDDALGGLEDVDWEEWAQQFGRLDTDKLDAFKKEYQHSDEEKADLLEAYRKSNGSLEEIFTRVPCSEVLADEQRFVSIINAAISAGELEALPQWKKSAGDEGARKKMRAKAQKEANEAEEYAKELGVWDELFGSKAGKGKQAGGGGATDDAADSKAREKRKKRKADEEESEAEVEGDVSSDEHEDDEDEEDESPKQRARPKKGGNSTKAKAASAPKGKGKGTAKKQAKKSQDEDDDEHGDLAGLEALFAKRQASRSAGFDDMIARMEAQARSEGKGGSSKTKAAKGKGKAKRSRTNDDDDDDDVGGPSGHNEEPDEAAFLAARAKVDARRSAAATAASSSSSSKKGGGKSKRR